MSIDDPSRAWQISGDGLTFRAPCFGGVLEIAREIAAGIRWVADSLAATSPAALFVVDQIQIRDLNGAATYIRARTIDPYVQGRMLYLPQALDTATGLRLNIRYEVFADSLGCEITAQTIEPIAELALAATFRTPPGGAITWCETAHIGDTGARESLAARVARIHAGPDRILLLFADAGDRATSAIEPGGAEPETSAQLTFSAFRHSLEKGVVIVARYALFADKFASSGQIAAALGRWRKDPACL